MIRYQSIGPDTELLQRLQDLANDRRQFGGRRLFVLLRRDGEPWGIYRLYREEGFTADKCRARRKTIGTWTTILVEVQPNARGPGSFRS